MKERIIVLTHGEWGTSLIKGVSMIVGKIDFAVGISLTPELVLREYKDLVEKEIENELRNGAEHITIMTDLFGGTTTNVGALIANEEKYPVTVICGLNAPLLLEASMQIINTEKLDTNALIKSCSNSIFDVMERIHRKEEEK